MLRFLDNLAVLCPPRMTSSAPAPWRGGAKPRSRLLCTLHAEEMPSAPDNWFLFTERFYIKCFSFSIGSFNMFYRKPFYVPIKKRAIIADDEKQLAPRSHCMFRKSGYISPENDTIRSFLVHYRIRQRGALVKGMQSFSQSLSTLEFICVSLREHKMNSLLWLC